MAQSTSTALHGVLHRDGRTDEFFAGAARDELMIKRCGNGHWQPPDAASCDRCPAGVGSAAGDEAAGLGWARATGEASLVSWATLHGRDGATSQTFGWVELAEGPWLSAALEVDAGSLREGLPLRATFVHPATGESYPVFTTRSHS